MEHPIKPAVRPPSLLAIVAPALFMGASALALAGWQIYASQQVQAPAPEPVVARKPEPPAPIVPAAPEPPKPAQPAVQPDVLAQRRTALASLKKSIMPARARSQAATDHAKTALASLTEAARQSHLNQLRQESADGEMDALEAKLGAVAAHQDAVLKDLKTIAATPKPPREGLSGFSPVARPAKGKEYHFELRADRVAYIDLEKLMELVKKDVQVRVRLSGSPRGIRSEVGPVGEFGLAYEIGPANDPVTGATGFGMKGWEVVPNRDPRGESLEQASQPLSEFQRAIKSLSPREATITMWVYPSGFAAFRALRDQLHAQGFMVAARPLPEGIPVRGSPTGSLSAGQ